MTLEVDPEPTPRELWPAWGPLAPPDECAGESEALRRLCCSDPLFAQRYEGWEELGRGGGASVVKTYQRDLRQEVALKVVFPLSAEDAQRFVSEAQALMRCSHPCVVNVLGTFSRGLVCWLELELVEGETLAALLKRVRERRERLELGSALQIAQCLAEGLAAVHEAGVVHRDVKPGNVLLPRSGRPAAKLMDFGVARSLDATIVLEEAIPGSPKYLCPEALDVRGRVGPAGDVYALAVTLFQLFSGGLYPFPLRDEATVAEALDCHARKAPFPLRVLGGDLPDDLVDLVHRGLEKKPSRRPSAAEMAQVLRELRSPERAQVGRRAAGAARQGAFWLRALVWGAAGLLGLAGLWLLVRGL